MRFNAQTAVIENGFVYIPKTDRGFESPMLERRVTNEPVKGARGFIVGAAVRRPKSSIC
jgi:hypothetical protein